MDVKAVKYIVDVSLNMRKMGNLRRVYRKSVTVFWDQR